MKKQENEKTKEKEIVNIKNSSKGKLKDVEKSENKITQLSEEEQEELRAEARERYNRLLGCGG